MTTKTLEITLSQEELIFLLMLLKTPAIPGIEAQPMGNLKRDQVNLLMASAERSLMARGFIVPESEKKVSIDQVVLSLVGPCAVPELSVLVSVSFKKRKQSGQFYHAAQKMAVEHAVVGLGMHRFTAYRKISDFIPGIFEFLRLKKQPAAAAAPIALPAEVFQKASELATKSQAEAMALVTSSGVDKAMAETLVLTLAEPVSNGSFVVIRHASANTPSTNGFAFLEGAQGFWLMQLQTSNQTPKVNLTPTSALEMESLITDMLKS